ncbi:hypothetical protein [Flavobacterium sp. LB3P21]|uniref:hypothetical protein n=1 Tax=Flavobacterium sp. LB3P21 TaxID=3401719 RepID=UPI003AB0FAE9
MKLLKKIKHIEFIVDNEYDLDEIVRKYGKTGDEVEEHITGKKNIVKTQIIRSFSRIEHLGTKEITKDEYDKNLNNNQYRFFEDDNGIHYIFDDYEIENLTEEDYKKEETLYSGEFHYFTALNYEEFINDFDFEAFDSFFENVILRYCLDCQISIEKLIIKSSELKAQMILQDFITILIKSNDFLENFKLQKDSNHIQKVICGYLIYFNNIILSETKRKFILIFPRIIENIPSEVNFVREHKTFQDILNTCHIMQEDITYIDDNDENKRTRQILNLLKLNYTTSDQSQKGKSSTGKKAGSVDGIIIDKQLNEYYVEAINLNYIDSNNISEHINKIEFNYDYKGLFAKFVFVYVNIEEGKFNEFSEKYKIYIDKELVPKYERIGESEDIKVNYTNTRVYKSLHLRESKRVSIYHILLKFPQSK